MSDSLLLSPFLLLFVDLSQPWTGRKKPSGSRVFMPWKQAEYFRMDWMSDGDSLKMCGAAFVLGGLPSYMSTLCISKGDFRGFHS